MDPAPAPVRPAKLPFLTPADVADLGAQATYWAYRGGAAAAQLIPGAAEDVVASGAGRVARLLMPGRARMVARHQRRVRGRLSVLDEARAVDGAFTSYARYWLEMFRMPREVQRDLDRGFRVHGFEHIEAGLAAGNGVVLALPHLGGWEYAGAWLSQQGHRILVVVEPVEPPELFEWFVEAREAMGMEVVPLGADAAARALKALRDNRIVCLVSDRDLTGDGVEIDFFGERTTLPGGPATLALRAGAALLPTAVYFRSRGRHEAQVRPALPLAREGRLREDVARITQALAHEFEELIRAAPDQWHLMQPNWPSDRGAQHA